MALALILGLAACRSQTPALVLEFSGLPAQAADLTVDLFNDHWAFTGADVNEGPVTISRPDGRLHFGIDRGYLAGKGDRLRLPLETSERLALEAFAQARVETGGVYGEARGTAAPGQDLILRFLLAPQAPDDAGSGDGAADAAPTPGPDDAGAPAVDARPDLAGEVAPPRDTAPADGPPPVTSCSVGPVKPLGMMVASTEPSLAFVPAAGIFAAVWSDGSRVLFNAVDREGKLQHPADVVAVSAEGGATLRSARLAMAGDALALAYGKSQGGGGAGVVVRMLQPATGAAGIALLLNGPTTDGTAPELGALAFGTNLAVVSRAHGTSAAQARVDLVSKGLAPVTAQNHASLSGARAAAIGWAPGADRYGVAALDGSPAGGTLSTFDVDLGFDRPAAFTGAGAMPVSTLAGATVSVAGAGDRLAVAWIDGQPCPACKTRREVWLATLDARTGALLRATHVSASDSSLPKLFPHVVFDGASYAVAWEEYDSQFSSRVLVRRFDAELRPLGDLVDASAAGPARPSGDIDLVVEDRNRYALAFTPYLGPHHFTRITCTAPSP